MTRPLLALDFQSARRKDVDGRLHVADCNISKEMVCPYFGREIPDSEALGLDPNKVYYLYREGSELAKGAATFANIPLLIIHKAVSAAEPEQRLTVGVVGADVRYVKPHLKASIAVWTAEAIALIETGAQAQLSCGYRYTADMTPGYLNGVAFDGIMRNIEANHVALVEEGRAGPDVMVADELPRTLKSKPMKNSKLITRIKSFLALDADLEAVDAAIEKEKADDAMPEGMDAKAWDEMDDEEKKAAKDEAIEKKAAADKAKDEAPKEKEPAKDSAVVAAKVVAKDTVTVADMNAAIAASSAAAVAEATAKINAAHKAKAAVAPIVGDVNLDSADSIYAFALKHLGIDTTGVHASAFPAMLDLARKSKAAAPIATDSAATASFAAMFTKPVRRL